MWKKETEELALFPRAPLVLDKMSESSQCRSIIDEFSSAASVAVVVVSCDTYADLWPFFFETWYKYWPDCPFRTYLICNHLDPKYPGVRSLVTGPDMSWSDTLMTALAQIEEENLIMFLDDLLLTRKVETAKVIKAVKSFLEFRAGNLKLIPRRTCYSGPLPRPILVKKGGVYRVSTVCTLWQKQVLTKLLRSGETAWQFELRGSARADVFDGFYAWSDPLFRVMNTVVKGKWRRAAVAMIQNTFAVRPQSGRQTMSRMEEILYNLRVTRSLLLAYLPPGADRRARALFKPG